MHSFRAGLGIQLGNGECSFWDDPWINGRSLRTIIPLQSSESSLRVNDFRSPVTQEWDLNSLTSTLPPNLVQEIIGIPWPIQSVPDTFTWSPSANGQFSIKSTYTWLHNIKYPKQQPSLPWARIWKLPCLPKIRMFCWQLLHSSLPTSDVLHTKGVLQSDTCPLCSSPDSNTHPFNSCPALQPLRTILNCCHSHPTQLLDPSFTTTLTLHGLWMIWKARNAATFSNLPISPRQTKWLCSNEISLYHTSRQDLAFHPDPCLPNSIHGHTSEISVRWEASSFTD